MPNEIQSPEDRLAAVYLNDGKLDPNGHAKRRQQLADQWPELYQAISEVAKAACGRAGHPGPWEREPDCVYCLRCGSTIANLQPVPIGSHL